MRKFIYSALERLVGKNVPATGIGLFRCFYGIIVFQEIMFLLYFNALIFDPVPYVDNAYPLIPLFLCLWALVAGCLIVGWRCHFASIANYCFWVVFVSFTPMRHDFDGGFDQFMTGIGLFLIFLPINRSLSLDNLRLKLQVKRYADIEIADNRVTVLAYYLPVIICLGFLYFDSAIHKLFAEHWRNGLGSWLPSTAPYYISAIDLSWLLNIKPLQMLIGYSIIVFQFVFIFAAFHRHGRIGLLIMGVAFHAGITLSLNIYPFGLGMLICYILLVPFSWWKNLSAAFKCRSPKLTLYYDADSRAANRSATIIDHFDVFDTILIHSIQSQNPINPEFKNHSIIAVGADKRSHTDFSAWLKVLVTMRYSALLGWFLMIPGVFHWRNKIHRAKCLRIDRTALDAKSLSDQLPVQCFYDRIIDDYRQQYPRRFQYYLGKLLIFILILQLNSTLHYGFAYRFQQKADTQQLLAPLTAASNSILVLSHTFMGITPHALYLHDHFEGYDKVLALSYIDKHGQEQWLPFVSPEGRLLAPNWGRVQSMWANVAVTPHLERQRLAKFIMKVTAFWGTKVGLDLTRATFIIKAKDIQTPFTWAHDLRQKNLRGQWRNVGQVQWRDFQYSVQISDEIMQK